MDRQARGCGRVPGKALPLASVQEVGPGTTGQRIVAVAAVQRIAIIRAAEEITPQPAAHVDAEARGRSGISKASRDPVIARSTVNQGRAGPGKAATWTSMRPSPVSP